jgi:DnaD/phage-associated family protein
MSIFRVQKNTNFVVMDKTSLQDERLSWKAKGLHAYMLSLPNDWKFFDTELEKHAKDGRDSLKSAIKELKEFGYMKRNRKQNETGKFEWETLIFEQPYTEKPSMDKPPMEKPLMGNPQLLSNDNTNKLNKLNNDESMYVGNALGFYQQNIGMLSPYMTQEIIDWEKDLSSELVIEAMKIALSRNKANWVYPKGILREWAKKNVKTLADVEALSIKKGGGQHQATKQDQYSNLF